MFIIITKTHKSKNEKQHLWKENNIYATVADMRRKGMAVQTKNNYGVLYEEKSYINGIGGIYDRICVSGCERYERISNGS